MGNRGALLFPDSTETKMLTLQTDKIHFNLLPEKSLLPRLLENSIGENKMIDWRIALLVAAIAFIAIWVFIGGES
jgi:hypothetical protein